MFDMHEYEENIALKYAAQVIRGMYNGKGEMP